MTFNYAQSVLVLALEDMSKGLDQNRPEGYLLGRLAEAVELAIGALDEEERDATDTRAG